MKLRKLLILFLSSLLAGASAATTTATSTTATSTVTLAQIKAVVDDIRTRLGTPTCPASTGCSVAGNIQTLMDRGSMAIIQVESDPDPFRNTLNTTGNSGFFEVKKYVLLGNTIPGLFRDSTGSPRAFGYQYTDTQQHRLPKGRYLIEVLQPAPPAADLTCAMSPSITVVLAGTFDSGGRVRSCAPARVVVSGTPVRSVLFQGSAIFDFDGVDDEFLVRFWLPGTWFPTGPVQPVGATVKVTKIE